MTLRIKAPEGHGSVTFGAGCNEQREVVDGLVDCPLGERCQCRELALGAGYTLVELSDYPGRTRRTTDVAHTADADATGALTAHVIRAADAPKPRRRRTRKPKA